MNLLCFGEELEIQEKLERLLHGHVLGCDRVSGPMSGQGFPCVATWFSGCRQLLGRDIVLSCHDIALFLCCDDVATEVFLIAIETTTTRGQVMQQVWPWAGILCRDKVFLCRDIVWSRPRVFMSRHSIFMSRHSLVKTKSFYVATKYFYVATELGKVKRIYVATDYFCVATEFGLDKGF